jgi:hypothetical protein
MEKLKNCFRSSWAATLVAFAGICAGMLVYPLEAPAKGGLPQPTVLALLPPVTNGILTVTMDGGTGQWTVATGASHPHPNQTVLFGCCTSFITLRDATAQTMFVDLTGTGGVVPGLGGYSIATMGTAVVTPLGSTGLRATSTFANWIVVQDVVINGSTLNDTNVRATVTVTNTSGATRQYGVRYMWDWEIAGNDGSFFRTRNPDGTFTGVPTTYNSPGFQLFEEVDNIATPTFSVFATVNGGSLSPPVTTPDQLRYSNWPSSVNSAWDYTDPGSTSDSSTSYFWGFSTPLSLAPGASASFTQYITTQQSAVGPPSTPQSIPTMNFWALLSLAAIALGLGAWTLRRRQQL